MKKLPFGKWKKYWPVLVLVLVEVWLAVANVKPGTWLVGWDTTMPELNFPLNLQRILSSVWQEYRGLGVADGMAHAANLSHWMIIRLLAFILPLHLVRYAFVFLTHFLGGFGVYWLVNSVLLKKSKPIVGLMAGLFYLLNPFALQLFYTPLELFLIHFALMPWSIGSLILYLRSGTKKDLLRFGGVGLLGVSQAHVPTVFLSYGLVIGVVLLWGILMRKKQWKRVALAAGTLAAINLFWLLPYVATLFSTTGDITSAKMNVMSTLETQFRNDAYGDFASVALLRSFNLNYEDWVGGKEFGLQFQAWSDWWNQGLIQVGLWVVFGVIVVGSLRLILQRKSRKQLWPFGLVWLLGMMILGSHIPIVGSIYRFVRDSVPYLGQLLRFTFTKFGVMYAFGASACLAVGIDYLVRKVGTRVLALIPLLLLVAWPAFQGEFLYSKLKLEIPAEYFEVKSYLNSQRSDARVVYLPLSSYWGWEFNRWDYRGSGFLWQMIQQPMLVRSFDPWSSHNETFYNELSTAFYLCPVASDEAELLWCANNVKQVFDKYQVSLALLDESVILPGQGEEIIRYDLWKRILTTLDPQVDFASGFLSVYTVGENTTSISVPEHYQRINADTAYGRFDPFYSAETAYINGGERTYPFAGITRENISKQVSYPENELVTIAGEASANGGTVIFPSLTTGDVISGRIRVSLSETSVLVELLPFGELVVGEERLPLWLDQKVEVLLPEPVEQVWVMVNGEKVAVTLGEQRELRAISMIVGNPLTVDVFDAYGESIAIDGLRGATATKCSVTKWCTPVNMGAFKPGELISVVTDRDYCVGREGETYNCQQKTEGTIVDEQGIYWLDVVLNQQDEAFDLPLVSAHQRIASYVFDASMWNEMKRQYDIEGAGEVRWEMPATYESIANLVGNGETEKNCDVLERGSAEKSQVETGVLYRANNYGAYCDSWFVGPIDSEGIVRLTGENITGRGIKFSVFSGQEDRTILEQLLPNGGIFDQSFGFLTGLNAGSTINVETKSFGSIEGINRLDLVQFYPVPLTFLQQIQIAGNEGEVVINPVIVNQVDQWGTGVYKVKIQSSNYKLQMGDEGQNGLVVLNQGFDQGWVGLEIPNNKLQITNYKLLDHVKVNGWANGWYLQNSNDEEHMTIVVIIYWPQLLEWVGLGLLLTCGLCGVYRVFKTQRSKRKNS